MDGAGPEDTLLGRATPVPEHYAPDILQPIPRSAGRAALGLGGEPPFAGWDLWHAYELSWLDGEGGAAAAVGRFLFPADSTSIVESKSFKLYLNSLNNTAFESRAALAATLARDLGKAAGGTVEVELFDVADARLSGHVLDSDCLDALPVPVPRRGPGGDLLRFAPAGETEESLHTHLFRSLCPVTGQPDWATLWLHYRGPRVERESLLAYLLAYREQRDFHEQCVERIFRDFYAAGTPAVLEVQGFYTRRGGLDINPFRSTEPGSRPRPRLDRQ